MSRKRDIRRARRERDQKKRNPEPPLSGVLHLGSYPMKETGLMFKAPLVRAILSGQKTQTRHIVKWRDLQPGLNLAFTGLAAYSYTPDTFTLESRNRTGWERRSSPTLSPVGRAGDRIYVRETFNHFERNENFKPGCECFYRADGDCVDLQPWRPAIHMPKHAARIWLEVTGLRVERLQSISRGDAMAEGCPFPNMADDADPRQWFAEVWDSTTERPSLPKNESSKRYARVKHWLDTHPDTTSWAANPWVWVIDFKPITNSAL